MAGRERRVKGEGSVYQRHDHPTCPALVEEVVDGKAVRIRPTHKCRGTWCAQIDMGRVVKRRLRPTVTAKTRKELSEKLAKKKRELEAGFVTDNATVEQWLTHWIDTIAPKCCRQRTLDGYQSYINVWLIPHLGSYRLAKLKPEHVRALYKAMEAAGKGDSTRRQAHSILRRALVVAEREGRILRNPAALVDPPPVGKKHHTPLTLEQARQVLRVLDGDPLAARWLCALLEGMRQGECLGLRWEDVDIPNRRIYVSWELIRIKGQGMVMTPPKSETSIRPIPMLEPVAFLLERMERRGDYVFYGAPTDSKKDWTAWKALLVRAGVCEAGAKLGDMPALHAARGTTASLLDEAGVADKIIAEILGHSQVQITQRAYIHGNEARHREAMRALEELVTPT